MKKALKIILWLFVALLVVLGTFLFALRFKTVQTYLAQKLAKHFSEELHTTVKITSLDVKLFSSVELKGFMVKDLQKDTLLYTPQLTIQLSKFSYTDKLITVQTAQLDRGEFYLKHFKNGGTNLDFIINYFKSGKKEQPVQKKGKPYQLTLQKIVLNDIRFRYKNFGPAAAVKNTIDFNDLELNNLNTTIYHLDTKNHIAKARIQRLTFRDKSGFYLKDLTADATIDSNKMEFANLLLETRTTRITNYLRMNFTGYKDFSSFVDKVYLKAAVKNSVLDPRDLNYFVPGLRSVDLKLAVDGEISGYVNHIHANGFSVRTGQATYLKGNFDITGLPKMDETLLDLQFDEVYSNKRDAERILKSVSGKDEKLPEILGKFGNVYFKGRFTGFPKDFIADGEFKTSLGRIVSDVNMKLGKVPVYTGSVKAYDFDLGKLLENNDLGRVTLSANIKGASFQYNQLNETLNGKVSYIDFKKYRYTNVTIDGAFNKKLFKGKVLVNDKNLNLNFNGGIDLNPKLPVFNFVAAIKGANLHALHFLKDTLQVDADFRTNFAGSNLDNIQGNVFLDKIRLTNPLHSITVDSVSLVANGLGNDRSLSIKSDILDASIKGQYELNTLPDYFIATAKRYVPSLSTPYKLPGKQNFDLSVRLKYFEPIRLLIAPDFKVPDGAALDGKFVSSENQVTISGSAKMLEYKNVKVTNLILDETNTANALNIILSSDRVNFNDSLFVKNINIANILKNDSLSLNVKLSDKNATNQLDLNGLVEFSKDTTATFSLLPSDVIINRENWKVQEKVRIGFDKGKITISGFQLSRDNQVLSLNGVISPDTNDQLVADFTRFKLTTFNPLAVGFGVKLGGELNGKATMSSLTKNPVVDANLKVDSLAINNTPVGELQFNAAFDNDTRLIKTSLVISKSGKETLKATGDFNAKSESNSLNMNVSMDHSELIIFEPFIKNLVSSLKGTVSSNLKVTGTLSNPVINGSLVMNDAGMTVNYLKTAYHINDKVTVENSVIRLNNLVIKDPRNNEAIANGTVDMRTPTNPVIDITIRATNFLALNTTVKDNPLYYGTAYGTGTFLFRGPTKNIYIDIDAKTEAGTIFNIPLNAAATVSDNNFITFVPKDSSLISKKKTNQFDGVTMNFALNVDNNSEVNIFTDLGQLTGRGQSDNLNLNISSAGDFVMTGNYQIASGQFIFSPRDYINKRFTITSGGSIRWAGDPRQAIINLQAAYSNRSSLRALYNAAGRVQSVDQRTLVEAVINLSGNLMSPKIVFDLNFPDNTRVKDELQSYLSDEQNIYLQAFSFVALGTFTGSNASSTLSTDLTHTGRDAVSELLFNQFNNFLSQNLGLTFVDFNIRSLNDASATFNFFNHRFLITGGFSDSRSQVNGFTPLGGRVDRDVELQYLIRKDGSLALRASNKLNNADFLSLNQNNEDYVSAIGLVNQQDFDNFAELFKILTGQKRRENKRKEEEKKEQPIIPPTDPADAAKKASVKNGSPL